MQNYELAGAWGTGADSVEGAVFSAGFDVQKNSAIFVSAPTPTVAGQNRSTASKDEFPISNQSSPHASFVSNSLLNRILRPKATM